LFFSKGEKVQNILHNIKYNEQKELAIFMGRIFGERLQNNSYLKDVTTTSDSIAPAKTTFTRFQSK